MDIQYRKMLSVVVPCYNESGNLPLLLENFATAIKRDDIEVIIVNNGSSDATQEVLDRLIPKYPFARTVRIAVNQGYGFGIIYGLRSARGIFFSWTHADMQTDPSDVTRALEIMERSPCPEKTFVKGNRKGRTFVDNIFTFGMGAFETVYLGVLLHDINAQPNLFHHSFFKSWIDPPYDFSLDLYAFYMARKYNLKVIRFPVSFSKRLHGHSHWNISWKSRCWFIMKTLAFSFKLKKRLV